VTGVIPPDAVLNAEGRDFATGLLLALDTAIKSVSPGAALNIRGAGEGVSEDLAAWCELTGNTLVEATTVRRGRLQFDSQAPGLGSRLWIYTNFDCNLACAYCCARSSPRTAGRRFPVDMAAAAALEFASRGGQRIFLTGGEPFLHPEIAKLVAAVTAHVPVTILSNAMVLAGGSRRRSLEALDRSRVVVQVSLDSATPELHDRNRGGGAFDRALAGLDLVQRLGFSVRVAATLAASDMERESAALHDLLDDMGVPRDDRVVRPIARMGFASNGVMLTRDDLTPEPTIAVDGAWWHPVAVDDARFKLSDQALPLADLFEGVATSLRQQSENKLAMRRAFTCA